MIYTYKSFLNIRFLNIKYSKVPKIIFFYLNDFSVLDKVSYS